MNVKSCIKQSFCVIGKQGSTLDGDGFIEKLWKEANRHFPEVAALAKVDENGNPVGFWGAMSDLSKSFQPWADGFTKGLYLAGVEAEDDAVPPEGWTKWVIPAYEYLYVKAEGKDAFSAMLGYLAENGQELAGAVHDFMEPKENGQGYLYFPIRKL